VVRKSIVHPDRRVNGVNDAHMRSIAVIVGRNGELGPGYFLGRIADCWRENGADVHVLHDPEARVAADLAILHVDLTRVPRDYLECARRFPQVLNGRVTDISKRRVSQNLVRLGDGYDGPVIVKTDRNCGGAGENQVLGPPTGMRRIVGGLRRRLPWTLRDDLATADYRLFASVREVPTIVWLNRDLVVERFLPEVRDGYYCLRTWVFLGDRETNSLSYSSQPVVKSASVVRRELIRDVPDELREIRRTMGFDYGKFDYSIVDGRTVLYDANRTPSVGRLKREQFLPQARHLAAGLGALIDGEPICRDSVPKRPPMVSDAEQRSREGRRLHWEDLGRHWARLGPPLRPSQEDVTSYVAAIGCRANPTTTPSALILGVTVEICQLQWPRGTHLLALDRTEAMIHGVWPGERGQTICGDWLAMPLAPESRDVVFCDGGVTALPYPDGTSRLVASLQHVLALGGVCALRLYVPPAQREPAAAVLEDLLAGRIANLNLLKLRLGMSLQVDPRTGVELRAIWNAIHAAAPDFCALAARIGWDIDHLCAINTYRDSAVRYYFPTAEQVLAVFAERAPNFALQQLRRPSYELGERCPMIVLRKC